MTHDRPSPPLGAPRTATIILALLGLWLVAAPAPAQDSPASNELTAKLRALEAAREAGVLTDDEYARKKAELDALLKERTTPPPSRETAEKLKALEAAHEAGIVTDEEFERKKTALAGNPLASGAKPAVVEPDGVATEKKKGRLYRHVIGFSFWYPAGWTVKEHDDFLQLLPPDPGSTPEGPTELYFITGESVAGEGIQRADDPRVIDYLDSQVQRTFPALSRTGKPQPFKTSHGEGVVLEWRGKSPQGQTVIGRVFANILREHGVALSAIALADRLPIRDSELRAIFASFGVGEGQKDPQLVGTWSLLSTYSLFNDSPFLESWEKAQLASDRKKELVFRADGTWTQTETQHLIVGGAGVWLESGPEKTVTKGRWNAGGGVLYQVWEDQSWDDYKYEIRPGTNGRRLRLTGGKSGEIWQEQR